MLTNELEKRFHYFWYFQAEWANIFVWNWIFTFDAHELCLDVILKAFNISIWIKRAEFTETNWRLK